MLDSRYKEGWKNVIEREVFAPLGMRHTTAWISKTESGQLAEPYVSRGESFERAEYQKEDRNMQAAGGHVSTVNDLGRYLAAHITGGRLQGRQVLPESAVVMTHRQQAEQRRRMGSFQRVGWGLGWDIERYADATVLRRNGGFLGFAAHLSFMPERKVGVVVLANSQGLSK